jgi:Ca2+-binding RTX toxin-like protein
MTVVNAANATESVNINLVSDQFTFASGTPISNAHYTANTSGGDDIEYFGFGIATVGSPPAFGSVTTIESDLSNNNFGTPDVEMTQITGLLGNGAIQAARITEVTSSAVDFFNEVMSFNDTMTGSAFNDSFKGGGGSDTLQMGGGNDSAFGGAGVDAINGDAGNDSLFGDGDNDVLNGGTGNDTMNGGTGADTMAGASGNDIYVVDNALDTATDVFFGGVDRVDSSVSHTLSSQIENLTLTGAAAINGTGNALGNTINGNAANNTLSGLGGNDVLNGNAGNDVLLGGDGADTLNGGLGIDSMTGGAGNDLYIVDNIFDGTIEAANGGTDLVQSGVTRTLGANLENLTLTGAAAINGTGNTLANSIVGNTGANVLTGGGAADVLNGGGGDDDYRFVSVNDSTSFAQDRITSFTFGGAGTGDKVDCSVIDANTGVAGNQAFTFTAGPGGAGTIWVDNAAVGTDSIIFANVDGDASAEFQCAVADGATDQSFWLAIDFVL